MIWHFRHTGASVIAVARRILGVMNKLFIYSHIKSAPASDILRGNLLTKFCKCGAVVERGQYALFPLNQSFYTPQRSFHVFRRSKHGLPTIPSILLVCRPGISQPKVR
jgi:hypothetical protein